MGKLILLLALSAVAFAGAIKARDTQAKDLQASMLADLRAKASSHSASVSERLTSFIATHLMVTSTKNPLVGVARLLDKLEAQAQADQAALDADIAAVRAQCSQDIADVNEAIRQLEGVIAQRTSDAAQYGSEVAQLQVEQSDKASQQAQVQGQLEQLNTDLNNGISKRNAERTDNLQKMADVSDAMTALQAITKLAADGLKDRDASDSAAAAEAKEKLANGSIVPTDENASLDDGKEHQGNGQGSLLQVRAQVLQATMQAAVRAVRKIQKMHSGAAILVETLSTMQAADFEKGDKAVLLRLVDNIMSTLTGYYMNLAAAESQQAEAWNTARDALTNLISSTDFQLQSLTRRLNELPSEIAAAQDALKRAEDDAAQAQQNRDDRLKQLSFVQGDCNSKDQSYADSSKSVADELAVIALIRRWLKERLSYLASFHVQQAIEGTGLDWVTGEWSECNRECGGGKQTRDVTCPGDEAACGAEKPDGIRDCNTQACPVDCVVGDLPAFSQCSVKCGGGSQSATRPILVEAANGGKACPSDAELTVTQPCNTQTCEWVYGAWSSCSKSCGSGSWSRDATCPESGQCAGQPVTSASCNVQSCPQWSTGAWSACSGANNQCTQSRTVSCPTGNEQDCFNSGGSKPEAVQSCLCATCANAKPCAGHPQWEPVRQDCNAYLIFASPKIAMAYGAPNQDSIRLATYAQADALCSMTTFGWIINYSGRQDKEEYAKCGFLYGQGGSTGGDYKLAGVGYVSKTPVYREHVGDIIATTWGLESTPVTPDSKFTYWSGYGGDWPMYRYSLSGQTCYDY